MDRSLLHTRRSQRLTHLQKRRGTPLALLLALTGILMISSVLPTTLAVAGPPICEPDEHRDPETGLCRADGDDEGGPPKSPPPEPKKGQHRTGMKFEENCGFKPHLCAIEDITCKKPKKQYAKYTRREVYNGTRWVRVDNLMGAWTYEEMVCRQPKEPTDDSVWSALVKFGIPGGRTKIQPPDGTTLVNFRTNFYTTKQHAQFPLEVGPFTVQIRAKAKSYEWDFGDGHGTTTETPGAPYPDLEVTHKYEKAGTYQASVTIHYAVQWRYGGGTWHDFTQPLEAQTSPTTEIEVVESKARLGHDGS